MNGWGGDPAEIVCASVSVPGELLRLLLPPAPAWHALAQCRDHPTDLWFPAVGEDVKVAKSICAGCPVRVECLDDAVADPSLDHGIRGGLAPQARKRMRTASRRSAEAVDGGRVESSPCPPGPQHPAHPGLSDSENESQSGTSRALPIRSSRRPPVRRTAGAAPARGALAEIVDREQLEGLA